MQLDKRFFIFLLILFVYTSGEAQQPKRIIIQHSDNSVVDEEKLPGATIFLGNVAIRHEGISLKCKKAVHYAKDNYVQAYGDVVLNQGDTIIQRSQYTEYNGNTKKALSWGNVVLTDPKMTLTTDTLHFDRNKQMLFYRDHATIRDSANVLESKIGNYYLQNNMFQALSDVVITNPEYVLESNHLDYYTDTGQAFLYGSSKITSNNNSIYCEKGFYDTKRNISYFTKNARIIYKNREIFADSLFYNRNTGFSSANGNMKIIDTISHIVIKGNYAEYYEKKDSAFAVNRALAIMNTDSDSLFIHGDTLLVTGKPEKRLIRAYHNVKFLNSDMSGKCDSIHSDQANGLTQMLRKPVLWSKGSQITGDTIHLITDTKTDKLDSLKVLRNAFIIQKDSAGFNQIKGRDILGKFIENDLKTVHVIGNGEVIHFVRDDEKKLIGIEKTTCSSIIFELENGKLLRAKFLVKPEGETYPPSKLPENARKLRGFIWREDEKPLSVEDLFKK